MSILDSIKDALGKKDDPEEATEDTLSELEDLPQPASLEGEADGGDLLATVESSLGGFEKLMRKIPGYHGYKEKELRREADKLLRLELASQFDEQATAREASQSMCSSSGSPGCSPSSAALPALSSST